MSSPLAGPAGPQYPDPHHVQTSALPGNIEGGAEVVEVDDEADSESTFFEFAPSETTSISSSIYKFTYANGRRYQANHFKDTNYFLPNDEGEQDRLDLFHHIFLLLLGGDLNIAPLENPQKVLDVGTGTGIWAIDFADLHPGAQVLGTDISPIQPSWIPPNTTFEIDDMEDDWTFQDNYFDYIHMRSLSGAFRDWDAIVAQAYRKTAPGGYLEFQDYGCELFMSDGTRLDGLIPEHPATNYLFHITSAAERAGRPLIIARGMAERMKKAGFVDVQQQKITWPFGTWPKRGELKEFGKWGKIGLTESAYPFALQLLSREGWSKEKIKEMVDTTLASMNKGSYYIQAWFVYGMKPTGTDLVA